MIRLRLNMTNPFAKSMDFKDYIMWNKSLSKNWAAEFQVSHFSSYKLFDITIDTNWFGSDHAGPQLEIEILGLYINFKIYNKHHWNYKENRWYRDDEDPFE